MKFYRHALQTAAEFRNLESAGRHPVPAVFLLKVRSRLVICPPPISRQRLPGADNGLLRARRHPPSRPLTPVVSALSDAAWYDWRSGAAAFREAAWLGPRGRRSAC